MNDTVDSLFCGQIKHGGERIDGTVDLSASDPRDGQRSVRTGGVTERPMRISRVGVRIDGSPGVVLSRCRLVG
jgi:hypothetical protein